MTLKSDHVHDSATARLRATSYTSVLPSPTASVNNSPLQTTATSAFRHDIRAHFIADTHNHQESTLNSARNAYATPAPAATQEKLHVNVQSQQQLLIANPHEPQSQVHHDGRAEIRSSYPTNFAQHDRENAPATTTGTEAGRQSSSAPVVANEDHEMYAHDDHNHDTNNDSAKTHAAHTRQQEQHEQEQQRGIEMDAQEAVAYSTNADSEMRIQHEEDEEQTHAISHKSTHVDHALQMHHHQDTEASRDFATATAAAELRQDSVRQRENVLAHGQEHREGEDNMHTEHMHSSVTSRADHDVYLGQGGQASASESVHAEHVDSNAPRIHNDTDDNIVDQSIAAAHSGMAAVSDADAQAAQDPLAQRMDETTSNATPQLDPDNTMSDDQLRDVPSSQHEASAEIVHNDEQDQDEHAPHHALAAHPEERALHTPPAAVSVPREQEAHDSNAMVEDGTTTAGMQDDRTRSQQAFDDHDHDMSSHQPGNDAGAEVARALQTEASVFRAKDIGNQVTSISPMQKNVGVQQDVPTTHHEGSEMLTGSPKSKRPRLSLGLHKSPAVLARGESISLARRAAATAKKRRDEARAELERNGVRENMETAMERIVGSSASTRANVSQNKGKRLARVKWREEEVIALKRGVEKYGVGRWAVILREFANDFDPVRISVDLKDKWRNIYKIPKIRNMNPDLADAMLPASENGESALDEQVQADGVFDRGVETSQHGENAAVASDPAASHEVTEAERDGQNSQPETQASQHMASEMSQSSPATREGVSSAQQEIGRASRDRTSTSQDLEDEMLNDEQRRMLPANHGSLLAQSSETRSYDDSHKRTREEMIRTENVQDRTIGTDEHVHVAAPAESVSTVAADNNSAVDRHAGDRAMAREVHELEDGQHSAHDADAHDPLKEQLDAPVQAGIDRVQSIDQSQDFGHQVDQALDQRTSRQTQADFAGKTTHILEEASAEASANFSALGE